MVNAQPTGRGDINTSKAKAKEFAEDAKALGWKPRITTEGNTVSCKVSRGDESIVIRWENGRCLVGTTYTAGARSLRLNNASAAKKQMSVEPEVAAKRNAEVVTRVNVRTRKPAEEDESTPMKREPLPFDVDSSSDAEIIRSVIGKRITWRNSTTKLLESAMVLSDPMEKQRHIAVVRHPSTGQRVLNFNEEVSTEEKLEGVRSGVFRSVHLDAIRSVS